MCLLCSSHCSKFKLDTLIYISEKVIWKIPAWLKSEYLQPKLSSSGGTSRTVVSPSWANAFQVTKTSTTHYFSFHLASLCVTRPAHRRVCWTISRSYGIAELKQFILKFMCVPVYIIKRKERVRGCLIVTMLYSGLGTLYGHIWRHFI